MMIEELGDPLYFHPGQQQQQGEGEEDDAEVDDDDVESEKPSVDGGAASSEPLEPAIREALRAASLAARVSEQGGEAGEGDGEEDEDELFKGYIDHDKLEFYPGALEALGAKPALTREDPARRRRRRRGSSPRATAGAAWYDLPRADATPELKRDARVLEVRGLADPKRFYKKTDAVSEFAALGTVLPGRFERSALTKRQRKQSLTAELLADRETRAYAKRKYAEIQAAKQPRRRLSATAKDRLRANKARRGVLAKDKHTRLGSS